MSLQKRKKYGSKMQTPDNISVSDNKNVDKSPMAGTSSFIQSDDPSSGKH